MRTSCKKRCLICGILYFLVLSGCLGRHQIEIYRPRPVYAALDELRRRHFFVCSYEDPVYVYRPEMAFSGDKYLKGEARRLGWVPAPGRIRFVYWERDLDNPGRLVRNLLERAQGSGGAVFRSVRYEDLLVVAPVKKRNSGGKWIDAQSVLDVRLSMRPESGRGVDILRSLLEQVTERSGVATRFGMTPVNVLRYRNGRVEARNEIARDVLIRSLKTLGFSFRNRPDISWRLLCDPGLETCYLNLGLSSR